MCQLCNRSFTDNKALRLHYMYDVYVDWFNYRRLHGEIGHVPPAEFEEMFYASRQEAGIKG